MKAFALWILFWWIAAGAGRLVAGRVRALQTDALMRFVFSSAIGLGIAAYGVYFLGLVGALSFVPVTLLWVVLGVAGAKGIRDNTLDLIQGAKTFGKGIGKAERIVVLICLLFCLFFGGVALLACYLPPSGMQWDAVAYHLADPKLFLQEGRIRSLPTEHHSNFPFTLEMLFTVGLLYSDHALANLFHYLMGVLTVLALFAFAKRHGVPLMGWIAALLFVSTPVVLWEATVSYIDLGFGLFSLLAVFAAIEAALKREDAGEWVLLAGMMSGWALGTKYLALLPFALVGAYLLVCRLPLKLVVRYAVVALALGSPWYIKNIVVTQNPVYPYFFKRFPNSKYWSADRAQAYESEQQGFGYPHALKQPTETARNLLLAPWRLSATADRFSNRGEFTFLALFGGLYAGLSFALLCLRRVPRVVRDVALLGALQFGAWFFVAQVSRYLVSVAPLLALGAGYVVYRLCFDATLSKAQRGAGAVVAGGVVGGQALLMTLSLFFLPTSGREAVERGVPPIAFNLPSVWAHLTAEDGGTATLERSFETVTAMRWINANSTKADGVILYEDTRGYYLDRPYLWGNRAHSGYIPYDTMQSGTDLTRWLRGQGVRFALVNLNWSEKRGDSGLPPQAPIGLEREALQRWYIELPEAAEAWRKLISDAIRRDLWRIVYTGRGVAVLEIGTAEAQNP